MRFSPDRMTDAGLAWLREAFFPSVCNFCRRRCLPGETPIEGICRHCLNQLPLRLGDDRLIKLRADPDLPMAICPCHYEGIVRQALVRLKFGDAPEISVPFAALIADALLRAGPATLPWDAVIAIPLHATRERERGYNQAGLIAAAVARRLLLPDWSDCLERHKSTNRQSELKTMDQRLYNVENAFLLRSPQGVHGQHLLLIDDILSTGATLIEARKPLLAAGAASVTLAAAAS